MRARLAQLRWRWRQIPRRTRLGVVIAVVAITGLLWQHYNAPQSLSTQDRQQNAAASTEHDHLGHGHEDDGHAYGEYQPDPAALAPPPDFSPEAARTTVERFASNFASPNGNHDDWLTRISSDVMPELLNQYRLTDIRNVPQAKVVQVSGPVTRDLAAPAFQVSYSDGSRIEATVAMDITGWKVSSVVPLDAPGSAAMLAPAPSGASALPAAQPALSEIG